MIIAGPQRIHRRDDLLLDIRHDPDLAKIDANIGEIFGDIADILVLGPTAEDLVADDQKCCCDGSGHCGKFLLVAFNA